MTEEDNFSRATRLRATAHELLQLADEIEEKHTVRKLKTVASDYASLTALGARAAKIFSDRESRSRTFDPALLGEPIWDMLLYLFVAAVEKKRVRVTSLTGAAGVPQSTALRYLKVMTDQGLVSITPIESDHRVKVVDLTQDGMVRMSAHLTRTMRSERLRSFDVNQDPSEGARIANETSD